MNIVQLMDAPFYMRLLSEHFLFRHVRAALMLAIDGFTHFFLSVHPVSSISAVPLLWANHRSFVSYDSSIDR